MQFSKNASLPTIPAEGALPAPGQAPVYLAIGQALEYTGGEAALRKLLQMVHGRLGDDIAMIAQNLHDGDGAGAGRLLHALKGFLPIFSCAALVERVGLIESMGGARSEPSFVADCAGLLPDLRQLNSEIAQYLRGHCGAGGTSEAATAAT